MGKMRKSQGTFKGSFSPVCQFIGYQARCSVPSNFDMDYAYTLGATSAVLATTERNGYMAIVSNLSQPVGNWLAGGVPLTAMLHAPATGLGDASARPNIFPHRINLEGGPFRTWSEQRADCAKSELYENPGPIQLSGPSALAPSLTITSKFSYLRELDVLNQYLTKVGARCRPGCDPKTVRVATQSLSMLNTILDEMSGPPDAVEVRGD